MLPLSLNLWVKYLCKQSQPANAAGTTLPRLLHLDPLASGVQLTQQGLLSEESLLAGRREGHPTELPHLPASTSHPKQRMVICSCFSSSGSLWNSFSLSIGSTMNNLFISSAEGVVAGAVTLLISLCSNSAIKLLSLKTLHALRCLSTLLDVSRVSLSRSC